MFHSEIFNDWSRIIIISWQYFKRITNVLYHKQGIKDQEGDNFELVYGWKLFVSFCQCADAKCERGGWCAGNLRMTMHFAKDFIIAAAAAAVHCFRSFVR